MDGNPDDIFAAALQEMGRVTLEQLQTARAVQAKMKVKGENISLADVLVRQGVISAFMRDNVEKSLRARKAGGIKQLGAYKLIRKIGEGGMGSVFLAEDTHMGRPCALKVLPEKYAADREFLARFRREAIATGKLNHPNVVVAHTIGEEHGIHFYAMEYCNGLSLEGVIERGGKIPWQVAVDVMGQVCRGLEHAHEHGIIHRDIKPANIFVCRPPGTEDRQATFPKGFIVKILDLGLSKTLDSGREASFLTQTGTTLGTPSYISPEQILAEKELDGRTDIYSLGATFYHLLTGRTPFSGPTAAAVIMAHMRQPVPNPRDINPDVPEGVARIVQRMMAKKRDDRYENCTELLGDLEQVLEGERVVPMEDPQPVPVPIAPASAPAPRAHPAPARQAPPAVVAPAVGQKANRWVIAVVAVALILGFVLFVRWLFPSQPTVSAAKKRADALKLQQAAKAEAERAKREADRRVKQAEEALHRAEEKRKAEKAARLKAEKELKEREAEELKRQELQAAKARAEEAKRQEIEAAKARAEEEKRLATKKEEPPTVKEEPPTTKEASKVPDDLTQKVPPEKSAGETESGEDAGDLRDVLLMKNGDRLQGLLVKEDPQKVVFDVIASGGSKTMRMRSTFKRSEIQELQKLTAEQRAGVLAFLEKAKSQSRQEKTAGDAIDVKDHTWENPDPKGKPIPAGLVELDHFIIESTIPRELLAECASQLAKVYDQYQQHFGANEKTGKKVRVLIYDSMDQYYDSTGNLCRNPAFYMPADGLVCAGWEYHQYKQATEQMHAEFARFSKLAEERREQLVTFRGRVNRRAGEINRKIRMANADPKAKQVALQQLRSEQIRFQMEMGKYQKEFEYFQKQRDDCRRKLAVAFDTCTKHMFSALYHESFHAFLQNVLFDQERVAKVPQWLNEGLAQYFELARVEDGRVMLGQEDRSRMALLRKWNRDGGLVKLEDLIVADAKHFIVKDTSDIEQSTRHYQQSWFIVHWLGQNDRLSREILTRYVDALKAGKPAAEALPLLTGVPNAELQEVMDEKFKYDFTIKRK